MIGDRPFIAELMSITGPLGRRRVRFSPRQALEIGGARFADQLEDGTYQLDMSNMGFVSGGPTALESEAGRDDPDEDCLDLAYSIEMD